MRLSESLKMGFSQIHAAYFWIEMRSSVVAIRAFGLYCSERQKTKGERNTLSIYDASETFDLDIVDLERD